MVALGDVEIHRAATEPAKHNVSELSLYAGLVKSFIQIKTVPYGIVLLKLRLAHVHPAAFDILIVLVVALDAVHPNILRMLFTDEEPRERHARLTSLMHESLREQIHDRSDVIRAFFMNRMLESIVFACGSFVIVNPPLAHGSGHASPAQR